MKKELAAWAVIKRAEERHSLDVVPVKVGDKHVRREWSITELALQFVAEHTKSCAAIEDVNLISDADFYARGIPPVAQVLGLWSGRGTAHAPKLNLHKPRYRLRVESSSEITSRQNAHNTRDTSDSSHRGEGNK